MWGYRSNLVTFLNSFVQNRDYFFTTLFIRFGVVFLNFKLNIMLIKFIDFMSKLLFGNNKNVTYKHW